MLIFVFSIRRPPPSWIFDIYNFYDRNDQEGRTLSSGSISLKSLELRPRYGDLKGHFTLHVTKRLLCLLLNSEGMTIFLSFQNVVAF